MEDLRLDLAHAEGKCAMCRDNDLDIQIPCWKLRREKEIFLFLRLHSELAEMPIIINCLSRSLIILASFVSLLFLLLQEHR